MNNMLYEPIPNELRELLKEDSVIIHGGVPLRGEVALQGAKNIALQAIGVAILTNEDVILNNLPDIGDIKTNLAILEKLGALVTWNSETSVTINCAQLQAGNIDPREAEKTTGSKYFIPLLIQRFEKVTTGSPGGDRIGGDDRYQITDRMLASYDAMGIECLPQENSAGETFVEFRRKAAIPESLSLDRPYFGPTIQSLFLNVMSQSPHTFTLNNPSTQPEVIATINLLKSMGADIAQDPSEKRLIIKSKPKLFGTRFNIPSDPNALVSYSVMALITNGDVTITNIDHTEKVDVFIDILQKMNALFQYSKEEGSLRLLPSREKLRSVNLETDFEPSYCHTDWQQILTPLLALTDGVSYIDENVYPDRFKTGPLKKVFGDIFELVYDPARLRSERFKTDGKPHTLRIHGNSSITPTASCVAAPDDIRGATGLLAALLSAPGWSVMQNFNQIERGLAHTPEIINSLGGALISKDGLKDFSQ